MARTRGRGWSFAAGMVAALLLLAIAGAVLVFTGAYNVSAAAGHYAPLRAVFETAMDRSVRTHADGIEVPARFTEAEIVAGAAEYKAMCEHCHGGPGVQRAGWAEGIVPEPPEIEHAAKEWQPNEIFWIVRNGIKMTGMPAFGPTHDDRTVWNIVGFVDRIPQMSPEQYAAFESDAGHHGRGSGEGGGEAGHHGPGGAPEGHGH